MLHPLLAEKQQIRRPIRLLWFLSPLATLPNFNNLPSSATHAWQTTTQNTEAGGKVGEDTHPTPKMRGLGVATIQAGGATMNLNIHTEMVEEKPTT